MDDLDLLILGGFVGEGKGLRGQGITSFLLGCLYDGHPQTRNAAECSDAAGRKPLFVPFCKVGSGVSFDAINAIRQHLNDKQQPFKANFPSKNGNGKKKLFVYPDYLVNAAGSGSNGHSPWSLSKDDVPDYIIAPELSLVSTIKVSSFMAGDSMPSGLTARFPRLKDNVRGVRFDKTYTDILTLSAIKEIHQRGFMTAQQASDGRKRRAEEGYTNKVKAQPLAKVSRLFQIASFDGKKESAIFEDLVIHVSDTFNYAKKCREAMEDVIDCSKEGIEKLLQQYGTTPVASESREGCIVIVGPKGANLKVSNTRRENKNDIISYRWIVDCVRARQQLPKLPMYYLSQCPATREALLDEGYDMLGDHNSEEISAGELQMLLEHVDLDNLDGLLGPKPVEAKPAKQTKRPRADAEQPKSAAEAEEKRQRLEARAAERSCIVQDADFAKKTDWRQLAARLSYEELEAVMLPDNALWASGNLFYCDMFDDLGETVVNARTMQQKPTTSASPWLRGVCARAKAYGVSFTTHFHVGVTHILVDPSDMHRAAALRQRREALRALPGNVYEKYFISPAWAEDCIELGRYCPPTEQYKIKL